MPKANNANKTRTGRSNKPETDEAAAGAKKPDETGAPGGSSQTNQSLADAIGALAKTYLAEGCKAGVSPQVTDAITQAMLLVLGTGPAVAAYDELMSVQVANNAMYQGAVANQQRVNLLGMCMTAKCVRYMLNPNEPDDFEETIVTKE
ncbi:MAG: RebB family R body protein [Rhizomicrobium sp.]|jgi:hypothetical protein